MKRIHTIYFIFILNLFLLAESRGQGIIVYEDILVAQDSIHSLTFDEQTGWNAKRTLMEKLLKDTTLISEDTSITNFYVTYKNDNIGLLSKIRLAIDTINNVDSTVMAAIQSNLQVINGFGSFLAQRYSIMVSDTASADTLQAQVQSYRDSVRRAAAMNDSLYTIIQSATNSRAAAIASMNAALSSSKIYEQNEIAANAIYLSTAAIAQPDSLINYSTQLYNIASQCMLMGGPAVGYARSLYYMINDSIWFEDDQICASSSDTCLVPLAPARISGMSIAVCAHQYSYTIDSMYNVTGYTWSVTGGAAIDSGQGSTRAWISYTDTFVSGMITVYASDSCGAGISQHLGVTGYPDAPVSITGSPAVCPFASGLSYSIDSVQSATGYTWVVPSGCTIDSGQGTTRIVVDWDSLPGNVIVVAYNACSNSGSTIFPVDVLNCFDRKAPKQTVAASPANGDVKLYPNPTTGKVTVIYHLDSNNGVLQLFNVIGELVGSYELNAGKNSFEFDMGDLCCGIFEYKVTDDSGLKSEGKLIIIR